MLMVLMNSTAVHPERIKWIARNRMMIGDDSVMIGGDSVKIGGDSVKIGWHWKS